ncbi:carbohydrate ABC transporter permease [Thermasporomyces composti]|jgi:ABC-type glycerol-3-phosphate transport system permease component|uniref:Carbohydrate ABC transporter membrane protein 2 (CUT1 family) n=1 Tax=Thermasporomyces composti TaxID=696763 RepID=A0A3D9VBC2_THECX|nr:carbohydrate ABC transporter permease [Thermasporomyces composti]REF35444.1 carbohydrate ABC transporter membrane protein 2 (CUT1 family) [Thermasporomyces composti]
MNDVGHRGLRWVVTVAVALTTVVFVFPLYWMAVLATRSTAEVFDFPPPLLPGSALVDNIAKLQESLDIVRALGNTVYVAVTHTLLVLLVSSLAGYGFSRFREAPGHRWLYGFVMLTIFVPPAAGLIPWFVEMKTLGWINTYWPLILTGAATGFGVFWMRQVIDAAVPVELYDAARIDGAGDLWIYWRVVLPIIRPGLAALAVWSFMMSWNSFLMPLIILNDSEKFTLPLALTQLNTAAGGSDVATVMLGTTIGVLPVFVAFVLATKQFIAGLTAGTVR